MKQVVVYIAGPYIAPEEETVHQNILRAVHWASKLRKKGFCCIVSHLESMFNEKAIPENEWLNHGIELESRCDAVFLVPGWQNSIGVAKERAFADIIQIPVFDNIDELETYFSDMAKVEAGS